LRILTWLVILRSLSSRVPVVRRTDPRRPTDRVAGIHRHTPGGHADAPPAQSVPGDRGAGGCLAGTGPRGRGPRGPTETTGAATRPPRSGTPDRGNHPSRS